MFSPLPKACLIINFNNNNIIYAILIIIKSIYKMANVHGFNDIPQNNNNNNNNRNRNNPLRNPMLQGYSQ